MNSQNCKIKFLLFTLILLIFGGESAFSQYQIRTYALPPVTTSNETGRSIINRIDGGYTIVGTSNSVPSPGMTNWMFLKLFPTGLVDCARLIGFSADDSCFSVIQRLSDTGYVFVGYMTNAPPAPGPDMKTKATRVRFNKDCGFMLSQRIFDTLRHQYRQVVRAPGDITTNAGWSEQVTMGMVPNKILVTQYTAADAFAWGFRYGTPMPSTEEAFSICYQPFDGTYGVAARTNFFTGPAGPWEIMVMKLTPGGAIIWSNVYSLPPGSSSEPRKIIAMPDGSFTVTGFTTAFDPAASDVVVMNIAPLGGLVWSSIYGLPGIVEVSNSITYSVSDMTLVFTGYRVEPATGNEDVLLVKIPLGGGPQIWARRWDPAAARPADRGYDVIESTTGAPVGYAVTGHSMSAATSLDPILIRTNLLGQIGTLTCMDSLMVQRMQGQIMQRQIQIVPIPVMDIMWNPPIVNPSVTVNSPCMLTGTGNNENLTPKEYKLEQNYPNPFNPSTKIGFSLPSSGNVSVKIFDITGKEAGTLINEFKNAGSYSIEFNASEFPSGVYFYKIEANGFSDTKKMILMK